jgi:hypothetical protein
VLHPALAMCTEVSEQPCDEPSAEHQAPGTTAACLQEAHALGPANCESPEQPQEVCTHRASSRDSEAQKDRCPENAKLRQLASRSRQRLGSIAGRRSAAVPLDALGEDARAPVATCASSEVVSGQVARTSVATGDSSEFTSGTVARGVSAEARVATGSTEKVGSAPIATNLESEVERLRFAVIGLERERDALIEHIMDANQSQQTSCRVEPQVCRLQE